MERGFLEPMSLSYDLAFVGHFARDRLVYRGVVEAASGGGVYYGAFAARRLGCAVAVVTRLHPDDLHYLDEMRDAGIEVYARPAPATTGIENVYPTPDMDRRICRPLAFAGPFSPDDLPALEAAVIVVTPLMAGEVDADLVRLLASRGPVALDVQGFARVPEGGTLVTRPWPQAAAVLRDVTFLKLDDAEAEVLTGERALRQAAEAVAALGPREVVLTHKGGLLVYAGGTLASAPFVAREVRGRTGRGDTCFASYLAARRTLPPEDACRLAAAVTSLKMEQPGPYRGTREDAERLAANLLR